MEPKSVTFDTNVFSHIVRPEDCGDATLKAICLEIRNLIEIGSIHPHISETIFNLEGIGREDRPAYFGSYEPAFAPETLSRDASGTIHGRVAIGPEYVGRPATHPILVEKLEGARALKFRLLSAPRIGLPRNPLLQRSDFGDRTPSEMGEQQTRFFEALDYITLLGAGAEVARTIANEVRKGEPVWYQALKHATKKKAQRAIGEWSDGDSVAAHISYGIDYFCTRDEAKGAGSQSVFAPANRTTLSDQFGIKFVTPEDVLRLFPTA